MNALQPTIVGASIPIQPPSTLLMGAQGSGKSTALATFLDAGVELFVVGTEPNAADSLLDAVDGKHDGRKRDRSKVHFHAVAAAPPGWGEMMDVATSIQGKSYEDLSKIKDGIAKSKMTHWIDLIKAFQDFPDDLTGNRFGDVTTWGADRALVIDSLSGLNVMARQFTVGLKPSMAQGEWGVAMELEGGLIRKVVADRGAFFVLVAHLDRNVDEITQATKLMPAALGNKLAPQLAKDFSEIVLTRKIAIGVGPAATAKFVWSTLDATADLKNRALASGSELPPSFVPLVEAHRKRLAPKAA